MATPDRHAVRLSWLRSLAAAFVVVSAAACGGPIASTPAVVLLKSSSAQSGPIVVTSSGAPILANALMTFGTATLPTTTTIVISEANCTGPLFVSSQPAVSIAAVPATLPCVAGTVNAPVVLTYATYGISTVAIAAADQVFSYQINVVI